MTKLNLDEAAFYFYLYDRVVRDVIPNYGAELLSDWSSSFRSDWNALESNIKQPYYNKAEKYLDTINNA